MNLQLIRQVTLDALAAAGEIIVNGYTRDIVVEFKGAIDPVTEIDHGCEACIIEHIRRAFPDHDILTEESDNERRDSEHRWIIDPLDGTVNYSHKYPRFAASIAYELKGEILFGGIYDPILDELFSAERGAGAFLNGEPIHVSKTPSLKQSMLCTGFPYDVHTNPDNNLANFNAFILTAQAVRRDGSACLNLCYLANGRFDGVWELRMKPWDVAAGSLLITEAGGVVTNFRGQPFSVYHGEVLASNGAIQAEMAEVLRGANRAP